MNKTEKKIPSLCTDVRTNHKRRKWRAGDIKAAGLPSWQLSSSFWRGLCGAECQGALQSIIYQGKDCRPASPRCDAGSPQPLPPSTTATVNSRWHFSLLPYPRIQTTRPYSLEATSGVRGAAAHSSRYRSCRGSRGGSGAFQLLQGTGHRFPGSCSVVNPPFPATPSRSSLKPH